jgi:L-seryl-tRNA(Ser) seleniumtransferase
MVRLQERGVACGLLEAQSAVGGGSAPERGLPTVLLAIEGPASRLAAALRRGDPPVLARVEDGRCAIDFRTVLRGQDDVLTDAIEAAVSGLSPPGPGSRPR